MIRPPRSARAGRKPRRAISCSRSSSGSAGPSARRRAGGRAACLACLLLGPDGPGEHAGEPGIAPGCPSCAPPRDAGGTAGGAGRNGTGLGFLGHQPGVPEHRQVPAYRVVVELRVSGELGHADRPRCVRDAAEQAMPRRVPLGPGLRAARPPRRRLRCATCSGPVRSSAAPAEKHDKPGQDGQAATARLIAGAADGPGRPAGISSRRRRCVSHRVGKLTRWRRGHGSGRTGCAGSAGRTRAARSGSAGWR